MATTSKQLAAPHCSSSSSSPTRWDVFLSFYGKDTRGKFTSHLYSALDGAGISTFMDDPELEKGEEISSGLLNAIHGSKTFVVVLSENYAYSRWCLDELVEILTCKRTGGCLVIPVFYYVDPSDPRYQKRSFGDALDHHKKHYSVDLIDKWRSALAEIAELSGYHLKRDANENEPHIIQKIVEQVTPLISTKDLHSFEGNLCETHKFLDIVFFFVEGDKDLCETQKEIFLDIVFFFVEGDKDEAFHIFKSCEFFPHEGIPVLVERCLLTITKNNKFQMHNLIRDMGKEVIREESNHGNHKRLYFRQENGWEALEKLEGIEKIEGLIIDHTTPCPQKDIIVPKF